MKDCHRCKRSFPEEEYPYKKSGESRSCYCKSCTGYMKQQMRKRYQNDRKYGKGHDYQSRQQWLNHLGFKTYKEYLASELWKEIRTAVFKLKGTQCYLCLKPATELHHNFYHLDDLLGKRFKFINPICRDCHEGLEFKEGEKTTLRQAARAFKKKRKEKNKQRISAPLESKVEPELIVVSTGRIEITNDFIHSGQSKFGGWTRKQLAILGIAWPPQKGWKQTVIGKVITQEEAHAFLISATSR